ncbi:MAG: helix-turn-helix transcriptional regulator [Marinoscillum sp.]
MSELKSAIGKRMATLRKEAGDSQAVCAEKLGIKRGTLAAYEKGTNAAPDEVKKKFTQVYGTSLQFLISGSNVAEEPEGNYHKSDILSLLKQLDSTPINEAIISQVHRLIEENRNQKDKIIELLERLNNKA